MNITNGTKYYWVNTHDFPEYECYFSTLKFITKCEKDFLTPLPNE